MQSVNQTAQEALQQVNLPSFYLESVASTNDWAKEDFPKSGQNFSLYLADNQFRGKGRDDRHWQNSQDGHCLLSTWSFLHKSPLQPIFSPLAGLSVFKSLKANWPSVPFCLKAPNDIYINEKKLAGILIEIQTGNSPHQQEVFVGLGLNVLSAPKVDQPTCALADFAKISISSWQSFIFELHKSLAGALKQGTQPALSPENQQDLLNALSQNPHFSVDQVKADGSLVKDGNETPWWEL